MTFRKEIKLISYFLRRKKKLLFLLLSIMTLNAVFEALMVSSFLPFFSLLQGKELIDNNFFFMKEFNYLTDYFQVENKILLITVIVFIFYLITQTTLFLNEIISSWWRYTFIEEIQNELFSKYLNAPYSLFLNRKQGEFLYNCSQAPGNSSQVLLILPAICVSVLKTISILSVLLYLEYRLALVILAIGIAFFFLIRYLSKHVSYIFGKERLIAHRTQTELLTEAVSGIRQLKTLLLEKIWIKKFGQAVNDFVTVAKKDAILTATPRKIIEISGMGVICGIIIVMTFIYDAGKQTEIFPMIGVFAIAIQRILPAVASLGNLRLQLSGLLPNLELLYKELNLTFEKEKDGGVPFNRFEKSVKFNNIKFSYNENSPLFEGLNFCLKKNKTTAIVGSSGAGKSTLIDLLIRLYQVQGGQIFIDGKDFYSFKKHDWLSKIGFVSQDTFIFNASIRDNIKSGKENASEEEIIRAAKLAYADEFIEKMPESYNTLVGDRGLKLSGGQRQRIAIARALIRDPEIIIFDEATSALDNISENKIKEAISQLGKIKTVLISAHRLSTVQNSDYIYVLEHGKVVEEGTHQELFSKKEFYWNLYRVQEQAQEKKITT